jgi:hypothetical protein
MHQNGLYLAKEDIIGKFYIGLKKRFEYLEDGMITYT